MPFIKTKVSCEITEAQERLLKSRFGKAIELVPGKSEEHLLLEFEDHAHLWLRGEQYAPIAYIEAAIFGNEGHYGYDDFTEEVTRMFQEILGVPANRIYIKYEDIGVWGAGGMCFDIARFR